MTNDQITDRKAHVIIDWMRLTWFFLTLWWFASLSILSRTTTKINFQFEIRVSFINSLNSQCLLVILISVEFHNHFNITYQKLKSIWLNFLLNDFFFHLNFHSWQIEQATKWNRKEYPTIDCFCTFESTKKPSKFNH